MFSFPCSGVVLPVPPGVDDPEAEAILESGQEAVVILQFNGFGVKRFRCVAAVEYEFSSTHTCL